MTSRRRLRVRRPALVFAANLFYARAGALLHLHANRATAGTCLEIFADQLLALLAKNIAVLRFRLASSFAVLCALLFLAARGRILAVRR